MARQIIAIGGGSFMADPNNQFIDQFILQQANAATPRICLLPTASGDRAQGIQEFTDRFRRYNCTPTHLSLFRPSVDDLAAFLHAQEIIYVPGGEPRSMLAVWREWGIDVILRQAWEQGVILAGHSAGALCWYQQGVAIHAGRLHALQGLGMIPGSHCPHYDQPERREAYRQLVADETISEGVGAEDCVALHYVDDHVHQIVSGKAGARAYTVRRTSAAVVEVPLHPVYLGS